LSEPYDAPFGLLAEWLAAATEAELRVPDAMQLATVGDDGRPQVRTVLLKGHGPRDGLVFYTNYGSRKASALGANQGGAICLHWKSLARQILVEGRIERADDATSDTYFATRERGSQIGAWASRQSEAIPSGDAFAERIRQIEDRFRDRPVERPEFWGGYRLIPDRFEFWLGQQDRLHDRDLYLRNGDGWSVTPLYP